MAVNNLITNGGFESGNLDGWSQINAFVTPYTPHSGRFVAGFNSGAQDAAISQLVPITPGQNFQLLVSLSKYGLLQSPTIELSVTYLDTNNTVVGTGLSMVIPNGSLPSSFLSNWQVIYQVTEMAPTDATMAQVEIRKPYRPFFSSLVFIDDVNLLAFEPTTPPGPTGPTGTF